MCGGVATYRQLQFHGVVDLGNSDKLEKCDTLIHSDLKPFVFSNWYRPPDEHPDLIKELDVEFDQHQEVTVGSILVTVANVHHRK